MEYDCQRLQYVSNHYFQIKSENDDKYSNIACILGALANLPSVMMPLMSYLVIIYIYPTISLHLEQYSRVKQAPSNFFHIVLFTNPDDDDEQKAKEVQTKVTQKWKKFHLICLFLTSFILTIILVVLHIISASEFIDYGNEVLLDKHEGFLLLSDHYIPYIHAITSYFMIFIMFVIAIGFSICAWNLNSLISISISVNIIYTMCYFFPTVLLVFIHDPLQVIYTCFMVIVFVMFIYALIWSFGLAVLSRILLKQAHFTWFSLKTLIHLALLLTFVFLIYNFFVMIVNMVALGSFSDFQDLQSILLSLFIGSLSILVLKPARKYVDKNRAAKATMVTPNKVNDNVEGDEERNSTYSGNCVDQDYIIESKGNYDTKEEMDSLLQNDENTIV